MFWRFAFQSNSNSLENLVDKYLNNLQNKTNNSNSNLNTPTPNNNVELSTILLEEDFLPQLKKGNEKLLELLINPQVLSQLFSITLKETNNPSNSTTSLNATSERASEDSSSSANSTSEENNIKNEKLYNISLEVLSSEHNSIATSILADPNQSLMRLWEILHGDAPLDPALSNSFARVFGGLLTRKTKETLEFIFHQDKALDCILNHFENPIIMDLLLKLICLEEIPEGMGIVDWLHNQGLITKLVQRLAPAPMPNTHSETSQVILHIVAISQCTSAEQFSIGINPLIEQLVSEEIVQTIVKYMLQPCDQTIDSSLTFGVTIFIEIIRRNYVEGNFENPPLTSRYHGQRLPADLSNLVKILTENLGNFLNLLNNPRKSKKIQNSSGEFIPLGFERLKVCELIAELLHCSNMSNLGKIPSSLTESELEKYLKLRSDNLPAKPEETKTDDDTGDKAAESAAFTQFQSSYFDQFNNDSIISSSASLTGISKDTINSLEKLSISDSGIKDPKFLSIGDWTKLKFLEFGISKIFLDLFFQYELNNFLHVVVFDLIHQLLNLNLRNQINVCLLRDLFINCNLTARIMDAQKANDTFIASPRGYRLGYMGHLTFIAEETVKLLERLELELGTEIQDIKKDSNWIEYSQVCLRDTKQRDLEPLDGNFSSTVPDKNKELPLLPSDTTNVESSSESSKVSTQKGIKTNSPPDFNEHEDTNKHQLAKFLSQPQSLNQVHGGIIDEAADWEEDTLDNDHAQLGDHPPINQPKYKYRRFSLGSIDPIAMEALKNEPLVTSPSAPFAGFANIHMKAEPTTQMINDSVIMDPLPREDASVSAKIRAQTVPIKKHSRKRSVTSILPSLQSLKMPTGSWQSLFQADNPPDCPSNSSDPPPAPKPNRKGLRGVKMHSRTNSSFF